MITMEALITQIGHAVLMAVLDILAFPWWWYTRGMMRVLRWVGRTLKGWEQAVGLRMWVKNLFVPMFGQTDWQGRIISFFMRLFILIGRVLQVVLGSVVVLVLLFMYLAFPIVVLTAFVLALVS